MSVSVVTELMVLTKSRNNNVRHIEMFKCFHINSLDVSPSEVESEVLKSNLDDVQLQRLKNGELPGALWHLFRSDDVKYIREYLGRVSSILQIN